MLKRRHAKKAWHEDIRWIFCAGLGWRGGWEVVRKLIIDGFLVCSLNNRVQVWRIKWVADRQMKERWIVFLIHFHPSFFLSFSFIYSHSSLFLSFSFIYSHPSFFLSFLFIYSHPSFFLSFLFIPSHPSFFLSFLFIPSHPSFFLPFFFFHLFFFYSLILFYYFLIT